MREDYAPLLTEIHSLGKFMNADVLGNVVEGGSESLEWLRRHAPDIYFRRHPELMDEIRDEVWKNMPEELTARLREEGEFVVPGGLNFGRMSFDQAVQHLMWTSPSVYKAFFGVNKPELPRTTAILRQMREEVFGAP